MTLGSHYEYDAAVIKKAYGGKMIDRYYAPGESMGGATHGVGWGRRNYHPGQKKGDQTDYGQYNVLMLDYLSNHESEDRGSGEVVDMQKLLPLWEKTMTGGSWGAWMCTQTRQALQTIQAQKIDTRAIKQNQINSLGGHSNAMALRSAAAFGVWRDEDQLSLASRKMMFTHASEEALIGGEFFTRVVAKILYDPRAGSSVLDAIELTAAQMGSARTAGGAFVTQQVTKGVEKWKEATNPETPLSRQEFVDDLAVTSMARLWDVGKSEPIKVGKASPTEGVMPSSIYFILKYQEDLGLALRANAMVGGDSASRAIAVGMVLGAWHGVSAIPISLRSTLNVWKDSEKKLRKLSLVKKAMASPKGTSNEEL